MSQAYVGCGDRISDRMGYMLSYNYESADDTTADPLKSDRHSFLGKLDVQLGDRLIINFGCFRNDIDDLVVRVDTGTLNNGLPLMRYENVEQAWTQGIEFMCNARPSRAFALSLSYTDTATENKNPERN